MSSRFVVSIIIPFHNCGKLTGDCLRSIARHTRDIACEIILIDDASTENFDPTPFLKGMQWRLIVNEQRKSYSENNNAAAQVASGDYLCLLNNDTLVSPGWLGSLVRVMAEEDNVGVLGNKHLYPDSGLLQHAGIAVTAQGEPLHLHPGSDANLPAVNYQREVLAVTFACVLIPRLLYRELNGLDEAYRNAYEDVDFCLRAAQAGYRILYSPASVIYHYGQSTPGRTVTDSDNRAVFLRRWGHIIPRNYELIMQQDRVFNTDQVAVRRAHRPGLHFILDCSQPSAFTWAGVELVMALHAQGIPVSLPRSKFIHDSIPPRYTKTLRQLFSSKPHQDYHIKWSHYWPEYFKTPLAGDVNAELFCTNYAYPDGDASLDLWTRHVLLNEYRKLPVSGFNDQILHQLGVPPEQRRIVPLGYSPEIERLDPDRSPLKQASTGPLNILVMTNSHDLYRYGTDIAIATLAEAYEGNTNVIVHIKDYGAGASSLLEEWIAAQKHFPMVVWHREFLPKEELIRLYASMDVQLSPFRGEGFAMKILDAMAVGLPCILPLFGGPVDFCDQQTCFVVDHREVPVGPCYDRKNYYLGDGATWCESSHESLVRILRGITKDRDQLTVIGNAARSRVRGRYTWGNSARLLMEALEGWQSQRKVVVSRRLGPAMQDISIVIPTKDRPDQLATTLEAYVQQTIPPERYEILLVNDHGDRETLNNAVSRFGELNLKILENHGPNGPGAARNVGIERSSGKIILITGDDIIPTSNFLETHLGAHQKHSNENAAFVGNSPWHPDLGTSPFLAYLVGEGGEQFQYQDMVHGHAVPFDRFYTSNVSIKRSFLGQQENLFSGHYRFAAFEDVELGYRLHLQGMILYYLQDAVGLHLHPADPHSFLQRQYRVGRMLSVLAIQRPSYIPDCHYTWLRTLEMLRCSPDQARLVQQNLPQDTKLAEHLIQLFTGFLEMVSKGNEMACQGIAGKDMQQCLGWLDQKKMHIWTAANEVILRRGLVDEWANGNEDLEKIGRQWVEAFVITRLISGQAPEWDVPLVPDELLPASLVHRPRMQRLYRKLLHNRTVQESCRIARTTRVGNWFLDTVRGRLGCSILFLAL